MKQRKRIGLIILIVLDVLMASFAWVCFFLFRKNVIEPWDNWDEFLALLDPKFWLGVSIIPLGWFLLYWLSGSYGDIYRRSRLEELGRTFASTGIGVTVLFFTLILDDIVSSYRDYYLSYLFLFGIHFTLTASARMILLSQARKALRKGQVAYNTLMIGGRSQASRLYDELMHQSNPLGLKFMGFVYVNGQESLSLKQELDALGGISDIPGIIDDYAIDEVVIAIEDPEHEILEEILNQLASRDVVVRIRADVYDIISGSVKMRNVQGAILIELYPDLMSRWQRVIKRGIDILVSVLVFLLFWWFYLLVAWRVRNSSDGPIFYRQERLGLQRKPFTIYKFRSMRIDAEQDGPRLSSDEDPRITSWGKIMRKWRIDELPQFFNVLKGDMSLVGPRPERNFYYEQLVRKAPAYRHLHKVKPGITSWGMVKYGYASNVEQMIERMKYDLLYIENMSLGMDLRIMLYTLLTLLQGKGK
jgi:exopolysaccharide biosynthesis polyprenyl glycosylphosphotransferase